MTLHVELNNLIFTIYYHNIFCKKKKINNILDKDIYIYKKIVFVFVLVCSHTFIEFVAKAGLLINM